MTGRRLRALVALSMLFALPLGCRAIIGVEERELVEGGAFSCATYCAAIQSDCTGSNIQYASETVCNELCAKLDLGTLDDTGKDTIGCRMAWLTKTKNNGEVDCQGAGPASTTCGTKCDLYCKGMEAICVEQFATFQGNCLSDCAKLTDCGSYVADGIRNDDSIECRLFHLTAAADLPGEHCPHTLGQNGRCDGSGVDGGVCDAGP
jgi:hypothetical protein